jgi:preprotein translocase subunit SecE
MAVEVAGAGAPRGPSRVTRLVDWLKGVRIELKKVTWPDLPQVRSATIAIIIFVLVLGLVIFILDAVLQQILQRLIPSLFGGR